MCFLDSTQNPTPPSETAPREALAFFFFFFGAVVVGVSHEPLAAAVVRDISHG